MWTYAIVDKNIVANGVEFSVVFTDDTKKFSRYLVVDTEEQLKQQIKRELDRLEGNTALFNKIVLGEIDLSAPTLTQKEIDRNNYFVLFDKYRSVQRDVSNGLLQPDDPAVLQLTIDLKAAYKPEYSGL